MRMMTVMVVFSVLTLGMVACDVSSAPRKTSVGAQSPSQPGEGDVSTRGSAGSQQQEEAAAQPTPEEAPSTAPAPTGAPNVERRGPRAIVPPNVRPIQPVRPLAAPGHNLRATIKMRQAHPSNRVKDAESAPPSTTTAP